MGLDRMDRRLKPLWIVLLAAAILLLIGWSLLFWSPAESPEGQVVPKPLTAPQ